MEIENYISLNLKKRLMNRFIKILILGILAATELFAAGDYQITLNPRRRFDHIELEVWIKSLSALANNVGFSTIIVQYDTTFLQPEAKPVLKTDTISANLTGKSLYNPINSVFDSKAGYNTINIIEPQSGLVQLNLALKNNNVGGIIPADSNLGSYIGSISFAIVDTPATGALAKFKWSKVKGMSSLLLGIDSTDFTSSTDFIDPPDFPIIGVNLIFHDIAKYIIDRDGDYPALGTAYRKQGFPIVFERTVDTSRIKTPINNPPNAIDRRQAYLFEYSVNAGKSWSELGRISEHDVTGSNAGNNPLFVSGQLAQIASSQAYDITTASGSQITKSNFREPLRALWKWDDKLRERSDKLKLRVTVIQGDILNSLATWTKTTQKDSTINNMVMGRLFFVQLNGSDQYFQTQDNLSNSTQLTVEAWINLNAFKAQNSEPAIIASSAGEDAAPVNGSKEGAWMLYLKNGKYPAFRAREIENRGVGGYLASLTAHYPINAVPLDSLFTETYDRNWTHIAATVDNNIVSLYVNGDLVDTFTNDSALDARMLTTNHPVWIGVNPNDKIDANDFLPASIKGVRVWRIALSQDQIRSMTSEVLNPSSISGVEDIRRGLDVYYPFIGNIADSAKDVTYQNGDNKLDFVSNKKIDNKAVVYEPDLPHIRITSPRGGEGANNQDNHRLEVRWVAYHMGDISRKGSRDVEVDFSTNGGSTWIIVRDTSGRQMSGSTAPDAETGNMFWEPYNNNDNGSSIRNITPYSRTAIVRVHGTAVNNQDSSFDQSGNITITPTLALKKGANSKLIIPGTQGITFKNGTGALEAWIKPFSFPASGKSYPIIAKVDPNTSDEFYSLKLLADGRLSFSVKDAKGKLRTATSSASMPVVAPNSLVLDTLWTHVAVVLDTKSGVGKSKIIFYVDGFPQNDSVQTSQLGDSLALLTDNNYPTYIGSYPGKQGTQSSSGFIGELREIRFWNGFPDSLSYDDSIPSSLTRFIQGAQSIHADELKPEYSKNLYAVFNFNGGGFVHKGMERAIRSSNDTAIWLQFFDEDPVYQSELPFIKPAEPIFKQKVKNNDSSLYVRWVGFDYDGSSFFSGDPGTKPSLEFSLLGGGGNETQPYLYVGSRYYFGNNINSFSVPSGINYRFNGTGKETYFAGSLNVAKADPDLNNDGTYNDQGPLSATRTNARFRLGAFYTFFGTKDTLSSESSLFTVSPRANFTLRILAEGYHDGRKSGFKIRNLAGDFNSGAIKIKLYKDVQGAPGTLVDSAISTDGYDEIDPFNFNTGNKKFANLPFYFDSIPDGKYWVKAEQLNHLAVMSRFPAPFLYTGDVESTWHIESGWDFTSWNGKDGNVLPDALTDPTAKGYYTAYGKAYSSKDSTGFNTTSLVYNDGRSGRKDFPLPAMVGGDAVRDGKIDSLDLNYIIQKEGTINDITADITGDGFINSDDRTIAGRNIGRTETQNLPKMIIKQNDNEIVEFDNKKESVKLLGKLGDKLLSTYKLDLTAELVKTSSVMDVDIYGENFGDELKLANCTFAFKYDTSALKFKSVVNKSKSIFDANAAAGYGKLRSAPQTGDTNAIPGLRTLEIDYDLVKNPGGVSFPQGKTYIGTLRFDLKSSGIIIVAWDSSTSLHTVSGDIINSTTTKDSIPPLFQFTAKITAPKPGDEFLPSSAIQTKWSFTGTANVDLEFTSNGGASWTRMNQQPIDIKTGKFDWTLPTISSTICNIRILDAVTGIELDRVDSSFSVLAGFAQIIRPSSLDAVYRSGNVEKIIWFSQGYSKVRFEISYNAGVDWKLATSPVDAKLGEISWKIPDISTRSAIIRMLDVETGKELAQSGIFKILSGTLTFISPKDGDKVYVGKQAKARWTSSKVDEFDLELSLDGINWKPVKINLPATGGSFTWIPTNTSENAIMRAVLFGDPEMELAESGVFKILNPTGGIEEIISKKDVRLYPNPAKEKIHISFPNEKVENAEILLCDNLGKVVLGKEMVLTIGLNAIDLDVTGISSGDYLVFLSDGKVISALGKLGVRR